NILKSVELGLLDTAREYAATYLPATSVGELFFERYPEPEQAKAEISTWYDEAAPELLADDHSPRETPLVGELCVLATPTDPGSMRFRELAQQALPDTEVVLAGSSDDIVFYRERTTLPVDDLEQFGPVAREAYFQMTASDNFTPHTRIDVDFRVL